MRYLLCTCLFISLGAFHCSPRVAPSERSLPENLQQELHIVQEQHGSKESRQEEILPETEPRREPKKEAPTVDGGTVQERLQESQWKESGPETIDDVPEVEPPAPNKNSPLGMNVTYLNYWMTAWPFVDVMKSAGGVSPCKTHWIPFAKGKGWTTAQSHPNDCKDLLSRLDPKGWPKSLPTSSQPGVAYRAVRILLKTAKDAWPAGNYTLLYEGEGTLTVEQGAKIVQQQPGKMVLALTKTSGSLQLILEKTDPNQNGKYIRSIRVIMPGFESVYRSQPFHPLYLKRLETFKVIRFMNWQRTNNSTLKNWNDRITPSHVSQSAHGAAIEHMVALANQLRVDPWFCMPHMATDDFVRQFAIYVRDHLHPTGRVYIEYSNETWNSIFQQSKYVQDQGIALKLDTNRFAAGLKYTSQRAVEIFKIWYKVFGTSAKQRVVRVLSSQAANTYTGTVQMDWKQASQNADAFAIAPYIGGRLGNKDNASRVAKMNLAQFFQELEKVSLPLSIKWVKSYAAETRKRTIKLIAYEGGQHLVGVGPAQNNEALNKLFDAANRDPRIAAIYTKFLQAWKQEKAEMFVYYSNARGYEKTGRWGVMEKQDQSIQTAPKYKALLDFITQNPRWW